MKPSFKKRVNELVQNHNPAILVVMETHVRGDRARKITNLLSFDVAIHTDTIGYAGDLWVIWNADRVDIALLSSTEQEIHVEVKVCFTNVSWLFSAVYASLRNAKRQVLLKNLMSVAKLHNMPWVIACDFNEPLLSEDKFGGRAMSVNRSLLFKECLDKCNMMDIGFTGPRFTWTNRRDFQALIQERIDRYFMNLSWCVMYPDAKITHLTRCYLDHCPMLLELQPRTKNGRSRRFRFQTGWLLDPSFFLIVHQAWERNNRLLDAINWFTQKAKEWNKNKLGNIFTRKNNLMLRLNGIQRALSLRPSDFLVKLEDELLRELDLVLRQEELWALKSRVNWMIQGDRNMTFYHISTLVRRKRNQIMAIKNAMGD